MAVPTIGGGTASLGPRTPTRAHTRRPPTRATGRITSALLIGAFLSLTALSHPAAAEVSNVTLIVGGSAAFGRVPVPDRDNPPLVRASLVSADGQVRARDERRASPGGDVAFEFGETILGRQPPIAIEAGDSVVFDPVDPFEVPGEHDGEAFEAAEITAAMDPLTARVTGTAPPDSRVNVLVTDVRGEFATGGAQSESSGAWSVDFSGRGLLLDPSAHGLAYFSTDDATTQTAFEVAGLTLAAGSDTVLVHGRHGAALDVKVSDIQVRSHMGAVAPAASPEPIWLHDQDGEAYLPRFGDVIEVAVGGTRLESVTVPALAVVVDAAAGSVTGEAPPNAQVLVRFGSTEHAATADAAGAWSILLDPDAVPADEPVIAHVDSAPWFTHTAYSPALSQVGPGLAVVTGRGSAGDAVTLTVTDGSSGRELAAGTAVVGATGFFTVTGSEEGNPGNDPVASLDPAAHFEVRVGSQTWTFDNAKPSIDAASAVDESVAGAAAPGSRVTVTVDSVQRQLTAASDGSWRADFLGEVDLEPGTEVEVTVQTDDGYITSFDFPVFRANVQTATPRVLIEGPSGSGATAELEREGNVLASGACEIQVRTCDLLLADPQGRLVGVAQGDDVLVFSDKGETALLEVGLLSAHIDPGGRDVVGLAPPSSEVSIRFASVDTLDPGLPGPTRIGTDSGGVFDHELQASEWPLLQPGIVADVFYEFEHGHRMFSRGVVEALRFSPLGTRLHGVAEPGATVTATLTSPDARSLAEPGAQGRERTPRDEAPPGPALSDGPAAATPDFAASGSAVAGPSGYYEVDLRSPDGTLAPIRQGMQVLVDNGRAGHRVTAPAMVAWDTGPDGAPTGLGLPAAPVVAWYPKQLTRESAGIVELDTAGVLRAGTTTYVGTFALPGPRVSRSRLGATEVRMTLPTGEIVASLSLPPSALHRIALPSLNLR